MSLQAKLHPARFPNMSPKMAALVGALLGQAYTSPAIEEVCVTSDGFVLARVTGDTGANEFIGSVDDVRDNFERLADAAGLTPEERTQLDTQLHAMLQH